MGRAAVFFLALAAAFVAGYAMRVRESPTRVERPEPALGVRRQSCSDDCEQTGIVTQAGPDAIASCKARCGPADSVPLAPRETPRSITVAPADHGRSTPRGR